MKCRYTIFTVGVGPVWIPQKVRRDTLRRFCSFHLVGFVGHVMHSYASAVKHRQTIFHARVGPVRFP
jgi:hypothetical protein